ncbi:MAG: hypothetical protein GY826_25990 [Fuerstiella sp.]|nr:hypothetical protein [Fuerstiella sp.]
MLQNLSAENLNSMENTVGNVVTILEYIDRLDSSLEEINDGSSAISQIVTSVDDAAGQSARSALHMNNSMADIRERNVDISEYSESTQVGVSALQQTMRQVADNLSQFKIESELLLDEDSDLSDSPAPVRRVYDEQQMAELEAGESRKQASL